VPQDSDKIVAITPGNKAVRVREIIMNAIAIKQRVGRFIDRLRILLDRQLTLLILTIAVALSGCVNYDTGIEFSSLNRGRIIERIQLGEQLNSFSQTAVDTWIASIEKRTQQANGKIERANDRELLVTIPFNNANDLVTKIDRFFNPVPTNTEAHSQFSSHLKIDQSNFFLAVKNHLVYDLDLRSLKLGTSAPNISISAADSVHLNFSISSPWGVASEPAIDNGAIVTTTTDRQMTWQLNIGKLNHIDVIFWLPNPLGIGAISIAIICSIGYYLKYRQFPWQLGSKVVGN
jgi:Protein of unknown function (DUF3153)